MTEPTRAQVLTVVAKLSKHINEALADPRAGKDRTQDSIHFNDEIVNFTAYEIAKALVSDKDVTDDDRAFLKSFLEDMLKRPGLADVLDKALRPDGYVRLHEFALDQGDGRQSYHAAAKSLAGLFAFLGLKVTSTGYFLTTLDACMVILGTPKGQDGQKDNRAVTAAKWADRNKNTFSDSSDWYAALMLHQQG